MNGKTAGLAAVAATIGVLAMSITALYFSLYLAGQNRLAASAKQEALVGQLPRTPEFVSAFLYNVSLCSLLSNQTLTPRNSTLAVINTGNIPVTVDNIVVAVDRNIVYHNTDQHILKAGEAFTATLPGLNLTSALVQVHTSRGGFFIGGYGIPKPETIIYVDENGRCWEP
ncbi:MAG: hypothetical protein QXV39_08685 [Candidatus Caldarchaeum sp.]